MNRDETRTKLSDILHRLNSHCLAVVDGPNGSALEYHVIGARLVILQFYKDGGCDHYIQSPTTTWEEMERELEALKQ